MLQYVICGAFEMQSRSIRICQISCMDLFAALIFFFKFDIKFIKYGLEIMKLWSYVAQCPLLFAENI